MEESLRREAERQRQRAAADPSNPQAQAAAAKAMADAAAAARILPDQNRSLSRVEPSVSAAASQGGSVAPAPIETAQLPALRSQTPTLETSPLMVTVISAPNTVTRALANQRLERTRPN